jgi:hypothetical protein
MKDDIQPNLMPATGPLTLGHIYRRADLHSRFGGNRSTGIVPSRREPVVLLFHTEEPIQQFYRDGFDRDGVYWYSGEGTVGDMKWTSGNRSVRDHAQAGADLLLFERAQRKDGLWRFSSNLHYSGHKIEPRPDKKGQERSAIVFGLRPLPQSITGLIEISPNMLNLPALEQVHIAESAAPLLRPPKSDKGSGRFVPGRRSQNAGPIGKRAEAIAYRFIIENATKLGAKTVRWVARDGITPGWDIEYTDEAGELISVEVKGTTDSKFANVELTAGEWCAATARGNRYWLFLVAECCGVRPRIQRIQNPAYLVQTGVAQVVPTVYCFSIC